ncbi:MAG TPA: hypothetical protein ENJ52_08340 [Aliiroseovarius sp.]|nr:hypothetical protein [Aliiroseovarius sp.]
MRKPLKLLAGAVVLAAMAGTALAATDYSKMRADKRVQSELLAASMAYLIDDECASIRLRRFKVVTYALSLSSYAKSLGYTSKEVEAYINDKDEQARFREMAEARLIEKGADPDQPESYCVVGRAEIEKRTYLGSMLKGG